MKMHFLKCLMAAALLPLAAAAQEQFSKDSWQELTAKAKQEHKPVFVDTYFEGCHPCKEMDDDVFPRPEVKAFMQQHFISARFDVFKEAFGTDLCSKYMISGFPTFLLLSPDGKLILSEGGFKDPEAFMDFLKKGLANHQAGRYLEGFGNNMGDQSPAFYKAFFSKSRQVPAKEDLIAFLDKQQDLLSERAFKAIWLLGELPANTEAFYLKNRARYLARFGTEPNTRIFERIQSRKLAALPVPVDMQAFNAFLEKEEASYSTAEWPEIQMVYAESYLLKKGKDAKKFLEFAIAHPDGNDNRVRYLPFYMGAQLQEKSNKELFLTYAEKNLRAESSMAALGAVAHMAKTLDNKALAVKYYTLAVDKAVRIGKDAAAANFRKALEDLK